jgi:hypothetical protein
MRFADYWVLVLSTIIAGLITLTLLVWQRKDEGFRHASGTIRPTPFGQYEFAASGEWDITIGYFPYAFYKEWSLGSGTRWELVRVDYPRVVLAVAGTLFAWWLVVISCRSAVRSRRLLVHQHALPVETPPGWALRGTYDGNPVTRQ